MSIITPAGHGLGWRRQTPDMRDYKLAVPPALLSALPPAVDLTPQMPFPPFDQGQLGSCTAQAIAAAVAYAMVRQGEALLMPSRLLIYYGERVLENTVQSDAGAEIRDGMKVVASTGVCPEGEWPYDISRFTEQPPAQCYADAAKHLALIYQSVAQDAGALKAALAAGLPVVVGISVYESFESAAVASSGVAPLPAAGEALLGGHAVLLVGFDDAAAVWRLRNSWGAGWGQQGYFTLPQSFLLSSDLASDFWVVQTTS